MQCPVCKIDIANGAACPQCLGRRLPKTTVLSDADKAAAAAAPTPPLRPTAKSPWDSTHPTARPLQTPAAVVPPPLPPETSFFARFKMTYIVGGLVLSMLIGIFGYLGRPVERIEGEGELRPGTVPGAPGVNQPGGAVAQNPAGNSSSSNVVFQTPTPSPQMSAQAEHRHHQFIVQVLIAWKLEFDQVDQAINLARYSGNRQILVESIGQAAANFDALLSEVDQADIPPRLTASHAFFRRAVYQGRDSFRQFRSFADTLDEREASQAIKSMQDALVMAEQGISLEVQAMSS